MRLFGKPGAQVLPFFMSNVTIDRATVDKVSTPLPPPLCSTRVTVYACLLSAVSTSGPVEPLRPAPTDPVGQSWPRDTGSVGDSVGEGAARRGALQTRRVAA